MKIAFATLLSRLSGWRLADPAPALRHKPNILLRGLADLPLVFQPTARRVSS